MGQDDEDRPDGRAFVTGHGRSSYDYAAEIRNAIRCERSVAIRAILPLALVGLVIEVYHIVHG